MGIIYIYEMIRLYKKKCINTRDYVKSFFSFQLKEIPSSFFFTMSLYIVSYWVIQIILFNVGVNKYPHCHEKNM